MEEKNFGYLGVGFQQSLIKVLIEDKKFSETIIDSIESKFFDGPYFKYLISNIKECHTLYNKIPDYETIGQKILKESVNETTTKIHLDTLKDIQNHEIPDIGWIKETSTNFCRQQVLKKALETANKILERGEFENYNTIVETIQKAIQVGTVTDESRDVFHDVASVLEKDSRVPIPTGIHGIDNLLDGGLGIGELGVIIAPLGTGKTTLATLFANTAYNDGRNVLQIIFEDNMNNVLRKHYTIWSGIAPKDQPFRKEEVIESVGKAENATKATLDILKWPSGEKTVADIKAKLRKMAAEGKKIELVIIDYVDCMVAERTDVGDEWKGEGSIMRHLDAMTSEFDIAIWVTTQGNRESTASEIVTTSQIGGSIKKAQIGHVVISVGKTLEQKEHNLATMTLLKSRIGQDGVVFQNCTFNNEYLYIDTTSQNTLLGHKEEKEQKAATRASDVYKEKIRKEMALREEMTNENKNQ